MNMITPRNNLSALLMPLDKPMLEEIDAVYEICDAEFASQKHIHDSALQIIKTRESPAKHLALMFLPHVRAVAARDKLMVGVPEENFVSIANQIGKDWDDTMGFDYRRDHESYPDPAP
jgi:hypothetical protein